MHFSKVVLYCILPFVFASPLPRLVEKTALAERESMAEPATRQEIANEIDTRQLSDLGNLVGQLGSTLSAVEQLLSPQSLQDIESLVTHASGLLDDQTTNATKSLLNNAGALLSTQVVQGLQAALPEIAGLLSQQSFQNITDILAGAHELLTPQFVSQTTGIINDVAPLVQGLSSLLSGILKG